MKRSQVRLVATSFHVLSLVEFLTHYVIKQCRLLAMHVDTVYVMSYYEQLRSAVITVCVRPHILNRQFCPTVYV